MPGKTTLQASLVLTLILISTPTPGFSLHWHEESYPAGDWQSGPSPLGFETDVATTIQAGHVTYCFRTLLSIPDEYDLPIDRLYVTIHSTDGVIVFFHGVEIGRSASLPQGDLDPALPAAFPHETGIQTFDASPVLNACDKGLDGNFRSIAVEVHRAAPAEAIFRFDAEGRAMSEGAAIFLLESGDTWAFDDSGQPPGPIPVAPIRNVMLPVRGMPVIAAPLDRIDIHTRPDIFPAMIACLIENRSAADLLTATRTGTDPRNLDVYSIDLPGHLPDGAYDLTILDPEHPETVPGGITLISDTHSGDLTVLHVTDSHIPFRGEYAPDNSREFQDVIDASRFMNPDLVIHTGDGYTEGDSSDQAELFCEMIRGFTSGFCYTPGNHELGEWCGSGDGRRNMWPSFGWPDLDPSQPGHWDASTRDWVFDLGPLSFLFMESWVHYTDCWEGYYPDTSFTEEQMAWLRYQAQIREDQASVILSYHHDFDDQLWSTLPDLGVDLTLSGHTHQSSVDTSGGVLYLKTAATYGSSRPMRWLRFDDGRLSQYPDMSATAVSVDETPVSTGTEDEILLSARNRESTPIEGLKYRVRMRPAVDYRCTGADITGQWDIPGYRLVEIQYSLDARETRAIEILPQSTSRNLVLFLQPSAPVFHGDSSAAVRLNLAARWIPVDMRLFIALEADGRFYFWPTWSETPESIDFRLPVGSYFDVPLFDLEWPIPDVSGNRLRFHAVVLDPGTGSVIGSSAPVEVIY